LTDYMQDGTHFLLR